MSCGPINPLQKLASHAQVDRSLQHDPQQRHHVNGSGFRTQHPNTLERDFQAHQQGAQHFDPMFQAAFQGPVNALASQRAATPVAGSSSWASDFNMNSSITMANRPSQQTQNWNTQFMNHMNSQNQQPHFAQAQAQAQAQHQMQQAQFSSMMYTPQLSQNQSLAGASRMTEHQELHSMHLNSQLENIDGDFDALEKEFDALEKEFQNVQVKESTLEKQPETVLPVDNNAGFRKAAKEVADVMKGSDSNKFANSKFLDLMNRVSAGQVALNQDETKLVDNEGRDIHKLAEETMDPSMQQAPSGSHAHLPDPLEFVRDGQLADTPFAAAKIVGEQHQQKYSWDDVYEDYRHDDSSF